MRSLILAFSLMLVSSNCFGQILPYSELNEDTSESYFILVDLPQCQSCQELKNSLKAAVQSYDLDPVYTASHTSERGRLLAGNRFPALFRFRMEGGRRVRERFQGSVNNLRSWMQQFRNNRQELRQLRHNNRIERIENRQTPNQNIITPQAIPAPQVPELTTQDIQEVTGPLFDRVMSRITTMSRELKSNFEGSFKSIRDLINRNAETLNRVERERSTLLARLVEIAKDNRKLLDRFDRGELERRGLVTRISELRKDLQDARQSRKEFEDAVEGRFSDFIQNIRELREEAREARKNGERNGTILEAIRGRLGIFNGTLRRFFWVMVSLVTLVCITAIIVTLKK